MLISIPPKYLVSQVVGYIKGKSAIHIARDYIGRGKNYSGMSFGLVATLFLRLVEMRKSLEKYIQNKEKADRQSDQLQLKLL